jgi:autotransporter-associated beta strand protein
MKPTPSLKSIGHTLAIAVGATLLTLSAQATLTVTNGTFGTVNQNGAIVDGGGWFESGTANWVEGSWANPGTYPTTFPSGQGMALLFDGAAANGYVYQKLGTVDANDLAAGYMRILSDLAQKGDSFPTNCTFAVYAGSFTGATGTDIANGGLTVLFTTNMDYAAQGLTLAKTQARVSAKIVGTVNLAGVGVGTDIWLRIGRPSGGFSGYDVIIDNVAAQLYTPPPPLNIGVWNGLGGSTLDSAALSFCTNAPNQPLGSAASLATLASLTLEASFADAYYDNSVATPVTVNNITVAAGGVSHTALTFTNTAVTYTLSSADAMGITGGTVVNKRGAGTVFFNGENTYNGATTISGGTLRLGTANAVSNSTVTVSVASGLSFASGVSSVVLGGLAGGSDIALTNQSAGAVTLQVGKNSASTTYSGVLSGTNGGLTKVGNGTLILNGYSTMTGPVQVNGGNLSCQNGAGNGALYKASSVTVNSGGTLISGANGLFGYNNNIVPIIVNAGGTMTVNGGTGGGPNVFGTLTLAGGTVADGGSLHPTYGSYNFGGGLITATGGTTSLFSAQDCQLRSATRVQVDAGSTLNVTGYFTPLGHSGNQTLTKTGPGTLVLAGANTHGATVVSNGTLQVDGTLPAYSLTLVSNTTLTGNGSVSGPTAIQAGAAFVMGTNSSTFTINSTLALAGKVFLKLAKNSGFATSDNITGMSGLTYGGTLIVTNITSDGNTLTNGDTFTLFSKASGSYSGSFATLVLPVLAGSLSWDVSGLASSGSIAVVNTTPTPTFNPPAGGYAGALSVIISSVAGSTIHYTTDGSDPTISLTVTSAASPATVVVPVNTNFMTLSAYATKSGAGNSAVATATYSTVATPTWTGSFGGSWTIASYWSNNVIAGGAGVTADFSQLTMSSDQVVSLDGARTIGHLIFGDAGGAYNWQLDTGSGGPLALDAGANPPTISVLTNTATLSVVLDGSSGLTKIGNGTLSLTANESYTGGTVVEAGTLSVGAGGAGYNDSTLQGTLTVKSGATCSLGSANPFGWGGGGLTDIYLSGGSLTGTNSCSAFGISYHLSGGAIANTGNIRMGIQTGYPDVSISSTSNGVTAVVAPTGGVMFENRFGQSVFVINTESGATPSGVDLAVNTALSQNASYGACGIVKTGVGTLALNATNTYTGATTVSNGTLLVNGTLAAGSAVTVTAGGRLGGTGTIGGVCTVAGTLSPGASIGTLTFNNNLTLTGNVLIEVDKSLAQSNDVVNVTGALNYGGTLTAINIGATPLVAGDSFPVFPAGGTGTLTVAGSPGPGLAWNFDPASGVLSVATGVSTTQPHLTNSMSGGNLNLSWPADHLGWRLEVQSNPRSVGLSNNWVTVAGSTNVTSVSIPISPANPSVFYRLVYP